MPLLISAVTSCSVLSWVLYRYRPFSRTYTQTRRRLSHSTDMAWQLVGLPWPEIKMGVAAGLFSSYLKTPSSVAIKTDRSAPVLMALTVEVIFLDIFSPGCRYLTAEKVEVTSSYLATPLLVPIQILFAKSSVITAMRLLGKELLSCRRLRKILKSYPSQRFNPS